MAKQVWIVANWKSHKTIAEALDWVNRVGPVLPRKDFLKVAVCPVFTDLEEVKKAVLVGNYPLLVGAQDLSPFPEGAYTGEEPAAILAGLADLVILGHSERRQNFGETDQTVAEKVKQARLKQIEPLICLQSENTPVPVGVKLVAYEPVFAIGSGHPDTPENAGTVAGKLKEKNGGKLLVLYGGSVTPENAGSFLEEENLDGLLVGGASLDPRQFTEIVRTAAQI